MKLCHDAKTTVSLASWNDLKLCGNPVFLVQRYLFSSFLLVKDPSIIPSSQSSSPSADFSVISYRQQYIIVHLMIKISQVSAIWKKPPELPFNQIFAIFCGNPLLFHNLLIHFTFCLSTLRSFHSFQILHISVLRNGLTSIIYIHPFLVFPGPDFPHHAA